MSLLSLARAIVADLDRQVSHGTVPSRVPRDTRRNAACRGATGADGTFGTDGANGPNGTTLSPVDLPTPADIAERADIVTEGDGCDRAAAVARALAEHGYPSWQALAEAHRERILTRLETLPPVSNDHGRRLLRLTHDFLLSDHWLTAAALGWALVELFGIDPYAPLTRLDGQGLVTALGLSKLNGGRLESLTETQATIRYRSGSLLTHRRGGAGLGSAVVWWEFDGIAGADDGLTDGGITCSARP